MAPKNRGQETEGKPGRGQKDRGPALPRQRDGEEYRSHPDPELPPMECFRCGLCCTRYQPMVTPEEVETIARGLGLSPGEFRGRYAQLTVVGYLIRQTGNGCVFLEWEKGKTRANCRIYPFRPGPCRDWTASLARRECQAGLARLK